MAGFYKNKQTKKYYAPVYLPNGKQKHIPLKTKNKREAKSRHKRIENLEYQLKTDQITTNEFLIKSGCKRKVDNKTSIKKLTDKFIKQYKLSKAPKTVTKYKETFTTLLETWGEEKDIKSLDESDYTDFLDVLKNSKKYNSKTGKMERRWNNTSINIKLRDLKTFLNWCVYSRKIERIPFKIEQLPVNKQKRMTFSRKQFDRLLEAAEERPFWQNFFVFMVNTGLRRGEVNPSVVKNGYLIVDASSNKNNRERMLKIPKPLIKIHEDIKSRMYHKDTYSDNFAKYRDKA